MNSMWGLVRGRIAQANAATARPRPGDLVFVQNVYRPPEIRQNILTIHRTHAPSSPGGCNACAATGMDLVQPCVNRTVVRIRFKWWFRRTKGAAVAQR